MGMEQQQRMKRVQQKFKMRGLTLSLDALKAVVKDLEETSDSEEEALDRLLAEMGKVSLKSNMVSKDAILEVLALLSGDSSTNIINCLSYAQNLSIHGDAKAKSALYRDRFQILQQRVIRDKHFAKSAFNLSNDRSSSSEMTPLQSLNGFSGRRWVMGTVSQVEDGCFCLEDLTACVPVDLSQAIELQLASSQKTVSSLLKETCSLVASSRYKLWDSLLSKAGASLCLSHLVSIFFGAGELSVDEVEQDPWKFGLESLVSVHKTLEERERRAINDMFVILSEVWLDHEETMLKLSQVFSGYEQVDVVPSLFIFMGNFCSHPCNLAFNRYSELRSHFCKLGEMINSFPRIKEGSRFLFIPGPDDPGPANVLPRPPLPKYFTNEILKHIPNAEFGSNPCRVRFYSQDMVFMREDLIYRMRRSCLIPPSEEETKDPFEHLVATLVHQSHLCPLPLTVQPISWPYDHSLHLYPTPHTIVLADRLEQKVFRYAGVTSFSPGSFSGDGAFVAYRPATYEPELSCL